ncbi:GDSL-like Lipase/Acylhydrolase [compost metagenome]
MLKTIKLFIMLLLSAATCGVANAAVTVDQYGDSTTVGLVWNGTGFIFSVPTSPDQLSLDLKSRFGAANITVRNLGVGSTCAKDLLYGGSGFASKMASSTAQIVTFNYGTNDGWYCNQTTAQYADQMDQLVKIAKAAGKIPVLLEPTPTINRNNPNLYSYVVVLSQVAINNKVAIVQHYRLWQAGGVWKMWLSDDTHLTQAGYMLKGDTEFQVLSPIVQGLLTN